MNKRKSLYLKRLAKAECQHRNHRIKRFIIIADDRYMSVCKNCGLQVVIEDNTISGEATTKWCQGKPDPKVFFKKNF